MLVGQKSCRTLGTLTTWSGAYGKPSDSILRDIRVSPVPNRDECRPSMQADPKSSRITGFRALQNAEHFPQWNQPVAAVAAGRRVQLKTMEALPEEGEPEMATSIRFSASLLYGVFSATQQTQSAVSMAKTEV